MSKTVQINRKSFREPAVRNWLLYELTEDDFLLGKTPEFFPDVWEEDE
jgi:hypothetical protein